MTDADVVTVDATSTPSDAARMLGYADREVMAETVTGWVRQLQSALQAQALIVHGDADLGLSDTTVDT